MKTLFMFFFILTTIFPQDKIKIIDQLLEEGYKKDIFSGTVLIHEKGKIIFEKSYGYQDIENKIQNNNDTKYNIGSIGKLFTQILILQLHQEGKLSLDDPLGKYLKLYSDDINNKITIKHLLKMSAGLGDYFRIPDFRKNPYQYKELKDLIELIKQEPLLFEPGKGNEYSNSGYVVLGGIIEKITAKSYLENLHERILKPLGMNNSDFIYLNAIPENTAKGYLIGLRGDKQNSAQERATVPTSAGGMYSTTEDLYKLDESLNNDNKVLNDHSKVLLYERFVNDKAKLTWNEVKNSPDFGFGIAGGSPGWNSIWDQNINGKYTVIILSNYDQGAEELLPYITEILKGKESVQIQLPPARKLVALIDEKGVDYLTNNFDELENLYGIKIRNDMMLNRIGYQFINDKKLDIAIEIFKLNVKKFPRVANVYDSLAEAYALKGDKENAIVNYKKAAELDPDNPRIKKAIEELDK